MWHVISQFFVLSTAPRELWILFLLKLLESFAHFSLSYVLVLYLSEEFGYSDQSAGWVYGFFGMLISIYGVLVGFLIDRLGVRLALMLGSFLLLGGRLGVAVTHDEAVLEALLLCVLPLGEALGVPVMLVGLRRYTSDENRRQAFALFYVVMNVGVLLSAPAVDVFRLALADGVDVSLHLLGGAYNIHLSAYRLLLLCGFGASVVMLAVSTCCLREVDVDRHGRLAAARRPRREAPWRAAYLVLREACFWRFLLFVVLLVGVRFIFRHLDATFPKYMVRQFDRRTPFGTYLALNPLLVIVLLPFISAFTPRVSAFRMILGGSLISAVSAFALAASPTPRGAIAFVALLSIGEAVWSPRLYEYSTMIAPKGREGTYMALASAPNFAARLTVGGLSGALLTAYCPDETHCDGQRLWLTIGLMTISSPILMLLLRRVIAPDEGLDDDHGDAQEKAPLVAHRGEYANGSAASGLTAATCKARPAAASQDFGNGIQC